MIVLVGGQSDVEEPLEGSVHHVYGDEALGESIVERIVCVSTVQIGSGDDGQGGRFRFRFGVILVIGPIFLSVVDEMGERAVKEGQYQFFVGGGQPGFVDTLDVPFDITGTVGLPG